MKTTTLSSFNFQIVNSHIDCGNAGTQCVAMLSQMAASTNMSYHGI